jgi:hypothetical protein
MYPASDPNTVARAVPTTILRIDFGKFKSVARACPREGGSFSFLMTAFT